MTLKQQVTKGVKWQLYELLGRHVLSFVVFTTLSRLLAPDSFGVFAYISVYLAFVQIFATQGLGTALIQRKDLRQEHIDAAFWVNVLCSSLLCLATLIFAGPIASMLKEPSLVPYLRVSSLILVINATAAVHGTLLNREMDFRKPAIRTFLANLVGGAAGVAVAISGGGVWALVGQQLFVSFASAVFLWGVSKYRPKFHFSILHFRELQAMGWSVAGTSLLYFVLSRLDHLVIGRVLGVTALGYYTVGMKLPELARNVTHQPVSKISMPAFSRLQASPAEMCRAIYRGIELYATLSCAVFVGLSCVATELVPLVLGAQWAPAASICSLLALYALAQTLHVFFHPALLAAGLTRQYLFLNGFQVMGVVAVCLGLVSFGTEALVIGLTCNMLIAAIPVLWVLKEKIGLQPARFARLCIVPLGAGALMAFSVLLVDRSLPSDFSKVGRLIVKVGVGAVVYPAIIFLLNRNLRESIMTYTCSFASRVRLRLLGQS